jgi:hypothetical protein
MQAMGGGMRLTATDQEAAARQSVVLPWELRQNGARSQVSNPLTHLHALPWEHRQSGV